MDIKYCKCGCGQEIIFQRHHKWRGIPDYIHGHSSRINNPMTGTHPSEETRKKLSVAHLGKKFSDEHKKRISDAQKGKIHTPSMLFKKGNTIHKGMTHNEETKKKMRQAAIGKIRTPETRRKIGLAHLGSICSEEHREKVRKAMLGRVFSDSHREKISKAKKENYKNPDFCKMMGQAWGLKPNKPETLMLDLLNNLYPNQWKFTGDFSFTINGKAPDFVNCNGQKKIIEVFGDYWHKGQNPQDRINVFKPFGYETLVIWEHELKEPKAVIDKIHNFIGTR